MSFLLPRFNEPFIVRIMEFVAQLCNPDLRFEDVLSLVSVDHREANSRHFFIREYSFIVLHQTSAVGARMLTASPSLTEVRLFAKEVRRSSARPFVKLLIGNVDAQVDTLVVPEIVTHVDLTFDRSVPARISTKLLTRVAVDRVFLPRHFLSSHRELAIPRSTKFVDLGGMTACNISTATFPPTLKSLVLGRLHIPDYCECIVHLPDSLVELRLEDEDCASLIGQLPPHLRHVYASGGSWRLISDAVENIPASITHLTLTGIFVESLYEIKWPPNLQYVEFEYLFSYIDALVLPRSVTFISIKNGVKQSLDRVNWPPGLLSLHLGENVSRTIDRSLLPKSLRDLRISNFSTRAPIDPSPKRQKK